MGYVLSLSNIEQLINVNNDYTLERIQITTDREKQNTKERNKERNRERRKPYKSIMVIEKKKNQLAAVGFEPTPSK